MDRMKLILYMYFLNIGGVAAGIYLIILFIFLGDTSRAMKQSAHTAIHLAVTLWFRNRFDLKP